MCACAQRRGVGVRVCVAVAAAFALAALAVQARQEEFMDDLGSSGMSVGAVQVLMIGLGLLMAALAPFERHSYGDGWRGRAVACARYDPVRGGVRGGDGGGAAVAQFFPTKSLKMIDWSFLNCRIAPVDAGRRGHQVAH